MSSSGSPSEKNWSRIGRYVLKNEPKPRESEIAVKRIKKGITARKDVYVMAAARIVPWWNRNAFVEMISTRSGIGQFRVRRSINCSKSISTSPECVCKS